MVERQYQETGAAPTSIENYVYATRTDGSWVRDMKRQIMPNGGWAGLRVVMDYTSQTRTAVDPSTESLTTYHYGASEVARLSLPPQACSADPNAEHVPFLGYDTVIFKRTLPKSRGVPDKITEWRALKLNCFALKLVIENEVGGAWVTTTREALYVNEGSPSPSLFEIPTGYVERSPSEVMAERARRFPNEQSSQCPTCNYDALDGAYGTRQSPK
jgi:hypothetical protein